jgi:chromosome segregation ATPase
MSDLEIKVANLDGQVHQLSSRVESTERTANDNSRTIVRIDSEQSSTKETLLRHSSDHKKNHEVLVKSVEGLERKISKEIAGLWGPLNKQQEYINKSIGRDAVMRYIFGAVGGAVIMGLITITITKIFGS